MAVDVRGGVVNEFDVLDSTGVPVQPLFAYHCSVYVADTPVTTAVKVATCPELMVCGATETERLVGAGAVPVEVDELTDKVKEPLFALLLSSP